MNPEGGTTGNTLFYINELFTNKEAVGRHVENAQKNAYFEKFGGIMKDYGVAVGCDARFAVPPRRQSLGGGPPSQSSSGGMAGLMAGAWLKV